jgi:hypothetical protein
MEINRLTITVDGVKEDNTRFGTISINGESVLDCNVDWLPDYFCDLTKMMQPVHAVQWYGDHGEIELKTRGSNISITELGPLGVCTSYYEERMYLDPFGEEIELQTFVSGLSDEEILLEMLDENDPN